MLRHMPRVLGCAMSFTCLRLFVNQKDCEDWFKACGKVRTRYPAVAQFSSHFNLIYPKVTELMAGQQSNFRIICIHAMAIASRDSQRKTFALTSGGRTRSCLDVEELL